MSRLELREVLVYPPGRHQFCCSDYPWLAAALVYAKGGDAGRGPDGRPGPRGREDMELLAADELGEQLHIQVGRGGRGRGGGGDGQDGFVLMELYARAGA